MSEIKKVAEIKKSSVEVVSDDESTPLRPVFCLKKRGDTKPYDETYDCFILDFDPSDPINPCISNLSLSFDDELSVVSEKGQVACRDYPHPRHLCIQFPFDKTPHQSFCKLCYCYVCDSSAPCKFWNDSKSAHCNASNTDSWKSLRNLKVKKQPPPLCS